MRGDRRHLTFVARKRRREFERSLQRLRDLGLAEWALECYRRVARVSGVLPHEVVTRVAVLTAGHILQNPDIAICPVFEDELPEPSGIFSNGRRFESHRTTAARRN
jgi:hypothetical protein